MNKRSAILILSLVFIVSALVACGGGSSSANDPSGTEQADDSSDSSSGDGSQDTDVTPASNHEDAEDYVLDETDITQIELRDDTIAVTGSGATAKGSVVTISAAGSYRISGSLTDGRIVVDTQDQASVKLLLNNISISNASSAPIYIANSEKTIIFLEDDTVNQISDGETYVFENSEEDEPNAALFSKDDLTIYGNGALVVNGRYNDGIASKDGLIIASGAITVEALDDGIRGKDYLIIKTGAITVTAGGDGLKADNDEDSDMGYIAVNDGSIIITAGGDAITAETRVAITDGIITLASGGGSDAAITDDTSAKGIKAGVGAIIDGGTITVDAADDAIHANDSIVINDGLLNLSTGDDAIHADAELSINGGDITVSRSFEGLESAVITISGGEMEIVTSDDAINAASDTMMNYLYIDGGYMVVESAGDGIDANGSISMTNGTVIVHGPTASANSAIDYDGSFKITGGLLVAAGSSGMAQAPDASSTQNVLSLTFATTQRAGDLVHIQTSAGSGILTFAPSKNYQSIVFSSAALTTGTTYEVYTGGSATGINTDGLYDGTYSGGSRYTSFTVSQVVTTIGAGGGGGMHP